MGASQKKQEIKIYKILISGPQQVGKTSLMIRFSEGKLPQKVDPTFGVEFRVKNLQQPDGSIIKLQFWEMAGGCRFQEIVKSYYKDFNAAFILFDVTDDNYLEDILFHFQRVKEWGEKIQVILLLGNKIDINGKSKDIIEKFRSRKISTEEAMNLANQLKVLYREISVKQSENFSEYLEILINEIERIQNIEKSVNQQFQKIQ